MEVTEYRRIGLMGTDIIKVTMNDGTARTVTLHSPKPYQPREFLPPCINAEGGLIDLNDVKSVELVRSPYHEARAARSNGGADTP